MQLLSVIYGTKYLLFDIEKSIRSDMLIGRRRTCGLKLIICLVFPSGKEVKQINYDMKEYPFHVLPPFRDLSIDETLGCKRIVSIHVRNSQEPLTCAKSLISCKKYITEFVLTISNV